MPPVVRFFGYHRLDVILLQSGENLPFEVETLVSVRLAAHERDGYHSVS